MPDGWDKGWVGVLYFRYFTVQTVRTDVVAGSSAFGGAVERRHSTAQHSSQQCDVIIISDSSLFSHPRIVSSRSSLTTSS